MQQQIFEFRDLKLFPSLNVMLREHFSARSKRKEKLCWLIKQQQPIKFKGKVRVRYIRHAIKLMDWDNHASSCKLVFDALKECGIITDDNPNVIVVFNPEQERVNKRENEKIIIKIEDYESV